MIEGIEEPLQRIADGIAARIPEPWTSASIEASYYADGSDYYGEYALPGGKLKSFGLDMATIDAFDEIRSRFKAMEQPVWGQARFELISEGKFNVRWGYENCDPQGDMILDPVAFKKRQVDRRKRLGMNF